MARVIWKDSALEDLHKAVSFYAADAPDYAEQLRAKLVRAARRLQHTPLAGRVVPEFGDEHIRELSVPPYRMIYVVRKKTCYIAAIIHSRRDLASLLRAEDLEEI